MNYYIIKKVEVSNTLFDIIFTDNQFNPIAFKYTNLDGFITTIPNMNYASGLNWLLNAVKSSREGGNLYRKPRRLTDEEYIELFDSLL